MHWIVSANFTSKYTLKTFIPSFKLVGSICQNAVWRYFGFWCRFCRTTFLHKYCKKINKSDYKCDISVPFSLKFAFNIFRKVSENIFEPKNAQHRACFDQIIVKAQMTPGSESATYTITHHYVTATPSGVLNSQNVCYP